MDNQIIPVSNIDEIRSEPDYSVNVSIEPNHEVEILEMKYDGQEIYKEPLTHSEYLAQLIDKIDFHSDTNDNKQEDKSIKAEMMSARKFFQDMHEKAKLAYDEICVLLDCLSIAKAEKLMSIEMDRRHSPSMSEEKPIDVSDKTLSLILKKKNIEKSKILLKKSLEKISNDHEYTSNKFHLELYRARQAWRIKKIGTKFMCDLSYRSVGCVNAVKANFELLKNDNPIKDGNLRGQYLSVIVPEEFEDYAYIRVEIVNSLKNTSNVFDSKFSLFSSQIPNSTNHNWQEILEKAQNAIYCKEIYYQLLREVFDQNSTQELKPVITGNSIKIMINIENDLIISLVHNADKNRPVKPVKNISNNFDNSILEYFLNDLLKRSFEQNFFHYDQRPITSTFAYNSHIKIAGMAYANLNTEDDSSIVHLPNNINHLLNKKKKLNLLQAIKERAEHLIIRKKVLKILNRICREICEPHFIIEPSVWNNATTSDFRIIISSYYYDNLSKSCYYISIKQANITVLNRFNNTSISFTECLDDLKNYFIDQCCFHQINLLVALSGFLGWTVLGSSFINIPGTLSMSGAALIYSNNFSKKIGIKISSVNQIEVYVFQYSNCDQDIPNMNENEKNLTNNFDEWIQNVKDNYTLVDLNLYPGFTQIQKYESFIAHFSTSKNVKFYRN